MDLAEGGKRDDGTPVPLYEREAIALGAIQPPPSIVPPDGEPLPRVDVRILAITLKRLLADDGYLVDFHPLISALLDCNTACLTIGTGMDAKVTLYYETKYLVKNSAKLIESVSLLISARELALKYGSTAEDADTPERKAKLMLSKLLNKTSGLQVRASAENGTHS